MPLFSRFFGASEGVHIQEVTGSSPVVPTTKRNEGRTLRPFCVSRISVTYAKYAPSSSHLK